MRTETIEEYLRTLVFYQFCRDAGHTGTAWYLHGELVRLEAEIKRMTY